MDNLPIKYISFLSYDISKLFLSFFKGKTYINDNSLIHLFIFNIHLGERISSQELTNLLYVHYSTTNLKYIYIDKRFSFQHFIFIKLRKKENEPLQMNICVFLSTKIHCSCPGLPNTNFRIQEFVVEKSGVDQQFSIENQEKNQQVFSRHSRQFQKITL